MERHPDYVTVTHGLRGHFAVLMSWSEEDNAYEPWQTSPITAKDSVGAARDGRSWAAAEGIEFKE